MGVVGHSNLVAVSLGGEAGAGLALFESGLPVPRGMEGSSAIGKAWTQPIFIGASVSCHMSIRPNNPNRGGLPLLIP